MTVEEDLSSLLLKSLSINDPLFSDKLASKHNLDHNALVGSIKSLGSRDDVNYFFLTEEGLHILKNGSHEVVFFKSIPKEGISVNEITEKLKYGKVGMSKALSKKWIKVVPGTDGSKFVQAIVNSVTDEIIEIIRKINAGTTSDIPEQVMADLKKRKLIKETKRTIFKISKGSKFSTELKTTVIDLTPEMINDESWKNYEFKMYNFDAKGVVPTSGALHPLLKVRSEVIRILIEMGFIEMDLNQFVESSFWNFDALFQPQQHPARDAHDTFFISNPETTNVDKLGPDDYIVRVKKMHEVGGSGSTGYQYDWKMNEAQKNLLRTHTTACSMRMLYRLANSNIVKPTRLFLIDRVFRNEALDATHLAEFHQVEGLVADYNIGLGHLKAIIRAFFSKLGLTQLRFKPAYNPYTEPSMEIFSYHPGLAKWVEIGNSGIFRPEVVQPMNLPPNMNVIAWGISLERPTMIRYGYKNIRDLFGPKINLEMIHKSPLCRIEKN